MHFVKAYNLTLFDLLGDEALMPEALQRDEEESKSAYEALVKSVNRAGHKGTVDLDFMSRLTKLPVDTLITKLHGKAIIQNPAFFRSEAEWDKTQGWMLLPVYLSGNIHNKLKVAKEMNKRFEGYFDKNIELLKSKMPSKLSLEDIYVGLGAEWVPAGIYGLFFRELFDFSETPKVEYIRGLNEWKIFPPDEAKCSVMNNFTYGTKRISGLKIAERTMNASTVKVYDEKFDYRNYYNSERVLNEAETLAAQEKQNLIIAEFNKWVNSNNAIKNVLEERYNDSFVGFTRGRYDGDFLELKDINPEVSLYPHQKSAIARIVLSGENVLLAHDVGAGKTYEMIIAVHELKRLGLSNKNLIVVPNNIFLSFVNEHRYLYPEDKLLVISPKDFTPDLRNNALKRIRDEDFDAIYMAYSSFDMIVMSKEYQVNKKSNEISKLRKMAAEQDRLYKKKRLRNQADRLEKKLNDYIESVKPCKWLNYDELGIDTLVVDEAHNYKNIPYSSSPDNIVGLNPTGSKKCAEMLEKVHFTKRTIFATGTPITNSLADLFTLQTYLQPEILSFRKLDSFDNWMQTFAERETHFEVKPDSSDIRPVTRFSSFHNLTELMGMFSCICDFHYSEVTKEKVPLFKGYTNIELERTLAQSEIIASLGKRSDDIYKHRVDRSEDNLLKITHDGRFCAVDTRLLGVEEPEKGKGKIAECARQVERLYREYPGTSQVVFSDIGTPKSGFNVYDELKGELTALGIPSKEIAYIHDAVTEKAKTNLFKAVNDGKIRVIIGSTPKLGVGVNIQKRLVALHHLSVPWRPSDMVQREGRIIRMGNECEESFIFRYITKETFDMFSWQLLENKQRFISSFLAGAAVERNADDVYDTVITYAEVKALAMGNNLIRDRVEATNKLERVKMASRQRKKQLMDLGEVIRSVPEEIKKLQERIRIAEGDKAFYEARKESVPNSERLIFGEELKLALDDNIGRKTERLFSSYQDFDVYLPVDMDKEKPYVFLQRENGGRYPVMMDCDKLMGYTKKLDYFLDHFSLYIDNLGKSIKNAEKRKAEAQADYDKGNEYREKIEMLTEVIAEIDEKLKKQREDNKNENANKS